VFALIQDFITGGIQTMTAEVQNRKIEVTFVTFDMAIHAYAAHGKLCTYSFTTFSDKYKSDFINQDLNNFPSGCKTSTKTKIYLNDWVAKAYGSSWTVQLR
jgi:hypothetical protein